MHQQSRYTQQIDVLELLIQTLADTLNTAIDKTQEIENLLYVKQRLDLKQYVETQLNP